MTLVDPPAQTPVEPPSVERLDSWKEIAAYLKRDESTVRRWEEEGLPVHRHPHKKKATIFAYKSELDAWCSAGRRGLETAATTIESRPSRSKITWPMAATMVLVVVALALMVGVRQRAFGGPRVGEISSIAVLPLKNLAGDPT